MTSEPLCVCVYLLCSFVSVPTIHDAEKCITQLNGFSMMNTKLRVSVSDRSRSAVEKSLSGAGFHDIDQAMSGLGLDADLSDPESSFSPKRFGATSSTTQTPIQPPLGRGRSISSSTFGGSSSLSTPPSVGRSRPVSLANSGHALTKSPEVKPVPRPCVHCSKVGRLQCAMCKAPYCSRDCQKADWEQHRRMCSSRPGPGPASAPAPTMPASTSAEGQEEPSSSGPREVEIDVNDLPDIPDDELNIEHLMEEHLEEIKESGEHVKEMDMHDEASRAVPPSRPGDSMAPDSEWPPSKEIQVSASPASWQAGGESQQMVTSKAPSSRPPSSSTATLEDTPSLSSVKSSGVGAVLMANQTLNLIDVKACSGISLWARLAADDSSPPRERLEQFLKDVTPEAMTQLDPSKCHMGLNCLLHRRDGSVCRAKMVTPPFPVGVSKEKSVVVDLLDVGETLVVTLDHLFELPADLQPSSFPASHIKLYLSGLQASYLGHNVFPALVDIVNGLVEGRSCRAVVTKIGRDGQVYASVFADKTNIGLILGQTRLAEDIFQRRSRDQPTGSGLGRGLSRPPHSPALSPGHLVGGASFPAKSSPTQSSHFAPRGVPLTIRMQPPPPSSCNTMLTDGGAHRCMQLPLGPTDVKLASVSPFSQLFLQLADPDWQRKLQQLNEEMNGRLAQTKNSGYTPREGDISCARYQADLRFYRARVERVLLDGRADVFFLDFGNSATVPVSELRHIPSEYSQLPFQAIRAVLAGLVPADASGSWSPDARFMLQRPQHLVAGLIVQSTRPDQPAHVELFDRTNGLNVLLNNELVNAGFAVNASPDVVNGSPAVKASFERAPIAVHSLDKRTLVLEEGKTYDVRVICTISVGLFYVQVQDEALQRQLSQINNDLDQMFADPSNHDPTYRPAVGECCCARWSKSGRFHRAKVIGEQGERFVVHFVDIGCREFHHARDIRRISPEMLKLPFLATPCGLANVIKKEKGANWPQGTDALFDSLTKNKVLRCVCQSVITMGALANRVLLTDNSDEQKSVDVGEAIIAAGLGRPSMLDRRQKQSASSAAAQESKHSASSAAAQESTVSSQSTQPKHLTSPQKTRPEPCVSPKKPEHTEKAGPIEKPGSAEKPGQAEKPRPAEKPRHAEKPHAEKPRHAEKLYGHKFMSCLRTEQLAPSKRICATITHVSSPSSFFVQAKDKLPDLRQLCNNIEVHCKQSSTCADNLLAVGDLCCAYFDGDGGFYRAVVKELLPGDHVRVVYVDFGNSADVSVSSVYPPYLPGTLQDEDNTCPQQLPAQAIECELGVKLPEGTCSWPEDVCHLLADCVYQSFEVMRVGSPQSSRTPIPVDIFDMSTGESLCEIVQEQHLPRTVSDKSTMESTANSADASVSLSDFQRDTTQEASLKLPVDDSSGGGDVAQPAERMSPFGSSSPPSVVQSPAACLMITDFPKEKLPDGETNVILTELGTPSSFYVQLASQTGGKELVSLMQKMNQSYAESKASMGTVDTVGGAMCAAFFAEDQGWYRAVVDSVTSDGEVSVIYADFGNSATVCKAQLRPLLAEFCSLPLQAVRCSLSGVQPLSGEQWSLPAIDLFHKHLGGSVFKRCDVCRTGDCVDGVEVVTVTSNVSPPSTISDILIESGCARQPVAEAARLMLSDLTSVVPDNEEFTVVMISEAESPSSIYLQLAKKEVSTSLSQLSSDLAAHSRQAAVPCVEDLAINELCAAMWTVDQRWYRASVVETRDRQAVVRFVDFGNKEIVNVTDIRLLTTDFLQLPAQAMHCRFAGIASSSPEGRWQPEWKSVLAPFTASPLCARVVKTSENGVYDVELIDTSSSGDIDLAQELVSAGFAVQTADRHGSNTEPTSSARSSERNEPDAPRKIFLNDISVVKPESADFFRAVICEVESPESLFVQLCAPDVHEKLLQLGTELTSACKTASPCDFSQLAVNEMCAARFSADQRWYRAAVCSVQPSSADVRFVDFGNVERVTVGSVCSLSEEFTRLPIQALHCRLAGAVSSNANGSWSPEASQVLKKFTSVLAGELLAVEDGRHLIRLVDTSSDGDVDLLNQLVVAGHAVLQSSPAHETQPAEECVRQTQSESKLTVREMAVIDPPTDDYFEAMLSEVVSPSSLFIHIAPHDVQDRLSSLHQELSAHCCQADKMDLKLLSVDQVCAARFSADRKWYRAVVTQTTAEQVSVRFLDYGNEDVVTEGSVCSLDKKFVSLPCQAVHCQLANVQSAKEGPWPADASAAIRRHGTVKLCVRCVGKTDDGVHLVEMVNTSGVNDVDLAQELVAAGVARLSGSGGPVIPPAIIPTENTFPVIVADIRSPGDMHVQVMNAEAVRELAEMIAKMGEVFNSSKPDLDFKPRRGDVCCALYSADNSWYRAKVDECTDDGSHYQVTFIDFGNLDIVPAANVRPIPEQFASLPRQAIPCCLPSIVPNIGLRSWCDKSTEFLREHAPLSKAFTAQVWQRSDTMLALDLIDRWVLFAVLGTIVYF